MAMTNRVIMQLLNEPFFNDLRTQQQLGYVVFSRSVNTRDVIGAQFLVQSPKRSCEYITNSINQFLLDMREKVHNLSDEDFEVQKQAVKVKLAEKDLNLAMENQRLWSEMSTHKYQFDRQDQEISTLESITRQELVDQFELTFFSEKAKRLDLQLCPAHHAEEQAEYKRKNQEHQIFNEIMKRREVRGSIEEFKKEADLHEDVYKVAYKEFISRFE